MTDLILPVIHGNGTRQEELVNLRRGAMDAIRATLDAVREMAPNGRDYHMVPGLMQKAVEQHRARVTVLEIMLDDIQAETMAICEMP